MANRLHSPHNAPYTIAVFASGGGSNLQVLIDKVRTGELPVRLAFVLSNNSKSMALERARNAGIPALHVSSKTEGSEAAAAAKMVALLGEHQVDLLVLAGYMKKVPTEVLSAMPNRVLNIHPALLPAFGGEGFYGHKVHEGVVARGCQVTGMTIHMVNEVYDAGQIVLQMPVQVTPSMSPEAVGAAVLRLEHAFFWQVVKAFAEGQVQPTESENPGLAVRMDPIWLGALQTSGMSA
jgi:phosphoribosylglycinamide formyltransferase 1